MSYVAVYSVTTPDTPNKVLTHFDDIVSTLAEHGVRFERWQPGPLAKGASEAEMIAACQPRIDALGYGCIEVFSVTGDHPQRTELRAGLLDERRYSSDQARFFIAGQGLFSLHIGDYVYGVRCEKNDLLVIPAGLPHWFDMGEHPHCVILQLSHQPGHAVAEFTGSELAAGFPGLDD
ncbi:MULTISPECIES: acireductone dioxygenase [Pseudomonas]|jgi:1,2-dihydroxy-3-keto-5-methylthiopentene dioxygenase|uniref:Acireductone dioxygenase n=3 Tax=Pseudomonas TaxID=286 RepID=A0A5M9IRD6_9PSED|nr:MULTISPECIES: acireductone dioxygenase [Pseudomonas]AHC37011.1 acireductone dioxygenase [Pseudomonas sp. TKP]KAA8559261.1 Acireductone dioxygenase [Pseudomonas extremaustralis]MBL1308556.1 acireductone dioxygenase [Pseudomonas sp.]MDR6581578.1 1,2-dihydroxy-3-keto-5-methylthiopentene dioxygenase [Pseudomonas extremaustralis]PMX01410.1 acireductone dioxygenase [Pseudomonas sp. MPBC4-3]